MRILCIDTASEDFALALAENGEVAASLSREGARDHSRLLLAAIDEILAGDRHLDGLGVVLGPGSYAGLRVGIATAQALALARGATVRGVPTLDAVAAAAGGSLVTAIHPAGRGSFARQDFVDGEPSGDRDQATAAELHGRSLAGESAAALGGTEVTPEQRCVAALHLLLERNAFASSEEDLEAIYLREPHITLSRRPVAQSSNPTKG